ncbi:N-acetylmuramoyl-L-alanine amidase [Micromonospora chalcea]|uniref:peptidoglycan recognition protein family protein n=1 Tax=unclassified Micromonospora TaxID=2617518 RepID=UPI000AD0E788|nr:MULTISPECIES: N-acetylmuramoyl-L-alanine amidase [unclassified Micromonospora]AXO32706.1 N-acetylmuramoyl-L-alanine amidase [Micromonospora sp. B006]
MATIPWLADVLRSAGVTVVEEGNWLGRVAGSSFNPIGVLWHHTAATSSATNPHPALGICINGRSDLPGPLCHALVDYHGVFHVISGGRANHAGSSRGSGPIPAGDGNTLMVGWEIDYNGVDQRMTPAQYSASVLATAAVLRRLGRDASYARGHRETSTTGKIDPSFIDLDSMRADVARQLTGNPPLELWKDDMKLIQSTNRGIALVGPGYFRLLRNNEEVYAAVALVGNPLIGNDRQFDLWRSIAFDGEVKAPS